MKCRQIITIQVDYDDEACSDESIEGDDCCEAGECEGRWNPVEDGMVATSWEDVIENGTDVQIIQASPPRKRS